MPNPPPYSTLKSFLQHAQVPLHKHSTVPVLILTLRVRQCYVMCAVSVEASGNGWLVGLRSSGHTKLREVTLLGTR